MITIKASELHKGLLLYPFNFMVFSDLDGVARIYHFADYTIFDNLGLVSLEFIHYQGETFKTRRIRVDMDTLILLCEPKESRFWELECKRRNNE